MNRPSRHPEGLAAKPAQRRAPGRVRVRKGRLATLGLVLVALSASGAFAATTPLARHDGATVVVREPVPNPGNYTVSVTVWAHSLSVSRISVTIGAAKPYVVTASRHVPTTVTAQLVLANPELTIRARGHERRPRVRIELTQLNTSSATTPGVEQPLGVGGTWKLIFDDEFAGTGLDSNWSTGWFGSGITAGIGGGGEPECYDPSHVVEANDELDVNFTKGTETCDGGSHPYTSGIITTKNTFSFTYGYVEFRAWLPTTATGRVADWPDLWADGENWPLDGEIDVVEGLDGQACAHYHGPTDQGAGYGAGGGSGCPAGIYTGGWHTFGADWEPGIVTWYYDGKDIGCVASAGTECGGGDSTISGSPMYLILSLGSNAAQTITAPSSLRVEYVRVWQHS